MKRELTFLAEGKRRLSQGGSRLYLALYSILLCAAWGFPFLTATFVYDGIVSIAPDHPPVLLIGVILSLAVTVFFFVVLTVPMTGGAFFFAYRIYGGGECGRGSVGLGRIYGLGLRMLWRHLPLILPIVLSFLGIQALSYSLEPYFGPLIQLIWLVCLIPVNLLFLLRGLFASKTFLLAFYAVQGDSIRLSSQKSKMLAKEIEPQYRTLFLRLFGHLWMAVLTIGALWVIHSFPYLMMSYFALGEEAELRACVSSSQNTDGCKESIHRE
ncbi:MAG: hypothetical protein IJY42_04350 [Clostridia bacterium]|nr:hypothetical protein [Clostridia bacterium]